MARATTARARGRTRANATRRRGARWIAIAATMAATATHGAMMALASDYQASDAALVMPFERAGERAMKRKVSLEETEHARTTAGGDKVRGPERSARALGVLASLARRHERAAANAASEEEREVCLEQLEIVRLAMESARARAPRGMEESGRAFAALGAAATAEEDVWEGSGGLMDSIPLHGGVVPGTAGTRRFGPLTTKSSNDDADAVKRFLATRRKGAAAPAERRPAARERLAPAAPWFKRKQPDVYWDVDLEKIQGARESMDAKRSDADDFDFEITDMPIKARKTAALGSSGEDESDVEIVRSTTISDEPSNATVGIDELFSQQVDTWTKRAMKGFQEANKKARQTIATISRQAVRAEEELLMKRIDVRMYVDFADPYSLELMLGSYQRLASMPLGPVDWNIVPFVNVGQERNKSANCLYSGHARHLSCTTNAIAACAVENIGTLSGGMRAFTSCYGMQLLKLESQDAFKYGRHEEALSKIDERCCRAVADAVEHEESSESESDKETDKNTLQRLGMSSANSQICAAQKKCAFHGAGYDLLKSNEAELGSIHPRHKWLPWVTIDGEVACRRKCNLQATVRRRICNLRTSLPEGCPKFPWAEAWYDEPEISFGGLIVTCAAVMLASVSLFVLMREAGMNPLGLYKDNANEGAIEAERVGLLPK